MERLIRDRILDHLLSNGLLHDSQHGFAPGRSYCTALLSYLEKVTSSVDDGHCVDTLYLDMSKTFDSVPHKRLIHKLRSYAIRDPLL